MKYAERFQWNAGLAAVAALAAFVGFPGFSQGQNVNSAVASSQAWNSFARDAQHTAQSPVRSDALNRIHWKTPVDLQPQYSGSDLLIHYGSPLVTAQNTVIVHPWSALESFPILHMAVLVNPLVYASEGLRGALVPQVPHMNTLVVIGALAAIDLGLLYLGLKKFHQKAVS